jgi:hypothetical protein
MCSEAGRAGGSGVWRGGCGAGGGEIGGEESLRFERKSPRAWRARAVSCERARAAGRSSALYSVATRGRAGRGCAAPRRAGRGHWSHRPCRARAKVAPLKPSTPHERRARGANRACFGVALHGPAAGQGRGGAEAEAEAASEEVEGLGEAVLPRQGRPARPGLRRGLRSARHGSQHECFVLEPTPRRTSVVSVSVCISATRSKVEER